MVAAVQVGHSVKFAVALCCRERLCCAYEPAQFHQFTGIKLGGTGAGMNRSLVLTWRTEHQL